MQKGLAVTATVVSAILIVIFVGITILGLADWNRFRPLIGDLSERITGRRLSIRGDLNGGLGFVPWVEAKDVTLANADWAASPMVEVGYVRLEWPFFENLVGVKKVRHLTVRDAKVRLARSRAGTPNWQLSRRRPAGAAPKKVPFTMPIFEDLLLENVEISLEDQRSGGTWTLSVARLSADDGRKPGRIEARGKLDDAPFRLVGNYDAHGDTLSVPRFEAALGRSQATGHLVILTGKRPNVDANLRFSELWLEDFLRLLPERPKKPRAGLFPDAPLDFEALLAFDGSVRFHAERFIGSGVAELITAIELRADLRGGRLRIDPMAIALAGGDLRGEVIFDVSRSPYETAVDLELDSVSLEEIGKAYGGKLPTKQLDPKNLATGLLHGTVELITTGRSAREFAGSIDGDIRLTIEDGSLGSVFVEALDLDLAESVTSWIAGNPTTPIRCMLVDLGAEKGGARNPDHAARDRGHQLGRLRNHRSQRGEDRSRPRGTSEGFQSRGW